MSGHQGAATAAPASAAYPHGPPPATAAASGGGGGGGGGQPQRGHQHHPHPGGGAQKPTTGSGGGSGGGASGAAAGGGGGGAKAPRRSSGQNKSHSRSYPRGVGLDFRKLAGLTLLSYIDHHGVAVRPDAPPSELAVAVARHFEGMDADEEECVGGFLQRLEASGSNGGGTLSGGGGNNVSVVTDYQRTTAYFDGRAPPLAVRKRHRSKLSARPGEQVAAKVTRTDENGSWILAVVQRFYADTDTYDVQDEDDTSKLIRLPWTHVMRLSSGSEGIHKKGTDCMAIFPETTSFYRATISKSPVWKLDNRGNPVVKEIIVKFEDDEDAGGRTPHRRVPARYVIPLPAVYFFDDAEDVDLAPPAAAPVVSVVGGSK